MSVASTNGLTTNGNSELSLFELEIIVTIPCNFTASACCRRATSAYSISMSEGGGRLGVTEGFGRLSIWGLRCY